MRDDVEDHLREWRDKIHDYAGGRWPGVAGRDGLGELHLFCKLCSAREFAPDAPVSGAFSWTSNTDVPTLGAFTV